MTPSSVGFARQAQGLIELAARYGPRRGLWLLDSAAGWHVLNLPAHLGDPGPALARHGVEIEGVWIPAATYPAQAFRLGRFPHQVPEVLALELPYLASTGAPIAGLLGFPLFAETPLTLDWEQRTLMFDGPPFALGDVVELPLVIEERQILTELSLFGETLRIRLETAANFGLLLERPDLEVDRFIAEEEREAQAAHDTRFARFTLPQAQFGPTVLTDLPALYCPEPNSPCDGRLGLGVLSRYDCYFDVPSERLLLRSR